MSYINRGCGNKRPGDFDNRNAKRPKFSFLDRTDARNESPAVYRSEGIPEICSKTNDRLSILSPLSDKSASISPANERLKRLKNCLNSPSPNTTVTKEHLGWKPPATKLIITDKVDSPFLPAQPQFIPRQTQSSTAYSDLNQRRTAPQNRNYNQQRAQNVTETITKNTKQDSRPVRYSDPIKYIQSPFENNNNSQTRPIFTQTTKLPPSKVYERNPVKRFSEPIRQVQTPTSNSSHNNSPKQIPICKPGSYIKSNQNVAPIEERSHTLWQPSTSTTIVRNNATESSTPLSHRTSSVIQNRLKLAKYGLIKQCSSVAPTLPLKEGTDSAAALKNAEGISRSNLNTRQDIDTPVTAPVAFSSRMRTISNTSLPKSTVSPTAVSSNTAIVSPSKPLCNPSKTQTSGVPAVPQSSPNSHVLSCSINSLPIAKNFFEEPMVWSDIDETEAVDNVQQLRKIQEFKPQPQSPLQHMLNTNNTFAETYQRVESISDKKDYYVVVDTNVFISQLSIIKSLLNINLKDCRTLFVYIPWMVIQELDYFKDSRSGTVQVQANARKAITFINECLGTKGSTLKAQLVSDVLTANALSKEPDDIILACCMQVRERHHIVVLLSNDKNLRNKVLINKMNAYSTDEILTKLKPITGTDSCPEINVEQIELRISLLLSLVIDESLREAFGDIYDKMSIKKPPWTLFCALELIKKYWISVFSALLQKQCLNTVDKLYDLVKQKQNLGLRTIEAKKKLVELTLALCIFLKISFTRYTDNINVLVKDINDLSHCK